MSNPWLNSFYQPPYGPGPSDHATWRPPSQALPHNSAPLASSSSTTATISTTTEEAQSYAQDDTHQNGDGSAIVSASGSVRPTLEAKGDSGHTQGSGSFSSKDSDQHDQHDLHGATDGPSRKQSATEQAIRGEQAASLRRGKACTFCRKRKLRCSGEKPKCTSCLKYNKECEYGQGSKGATFQQLESRIAELSEYIKAANPPRPPPPHQHPPMAPDLPASSSASSISYPFQPSASYDSLPLPMPGIEGYDPNLYTTTDSYLDFSNPNNFSTPDLNMDFSSNTNTDTNPFMTSSAGFAPFGGTPHMGFVPGWGNTPTFPQGAAISVFPPFSPLEEQTQTQTTAYSFSGPPPPLAPQSVFDFDYPPGASLISTAPQTPPNLAPPGPHPQPQPQHQPEHQHQSHSAGETTAGQQNYLNHVVSAGEPLPPAQLTQTAHLSAPLHERSTESLRNWHTVRSHSLPQSSPSSGSTPDPTTIQPPLSSTVDPKSPNNFGRPLPNPGMLHGPSHILNTAHIDPVEGITESLGEFLFTPAEKVSKASADEDAVKRRRATGPGGAGNSRPRSRSLMKVESDGLTESARELLLDCFLAHSRLFFEMSIPRFRYRMTFTDRRRPAPALLFAMYLWATRMSHSPKASPMEHHFFDAALKALDISSANGDRLIDCMRAAMLLSAYAYTSGRYHEGWILAGLAVRMVLSTGLHQIKSCVFNVEPPRNPFLRNKAYLLPPPEDAVELAERLGTFWCIVAIDRCSALATGFPTGIRDEDITTPFPRPLADIISGVVSTKDDITVKDLYRPSTPNSSTSSEDSSFTTWMKATLILERASKLAFLDPTEDSDYSRAWKGYYTHLPHHPSVPLPPSFLDQPQSRVPKEYKETKLALEQLIRNMGEQGIFPLDRLRKAESEGKEPPHITAHIIMIHHQFAAIHMLLHDVNTLEAENTEAIKGVQRAVSLIRDMPPIPHLEVDSFCVTVWSIITKVLIKELRRMQITGDAAGMARVEEDVNLFIGEMQRIGVVMQLARSQAKAMMELKNQALNAPSSGSEPSPSVDAFTEFPHFKGGIGTGVNVSLDAGGVGGGYGSHAPSPWGQG